MITKLSLGETIKLFRQKKKLTLREFSQLVGISPIYLSEIESGKKNNPSEEILYKIINGLSLTSNEIINILDLYAIGTDKISPDISEYVKENKFVQVALRVAKNKPATENDWLNFILDLNEK